jgi:hypothetical protein
MSPVAREGQEPSTAQKALTLHPKTASATLATYLSVVVFYILEYVWGIVPPTEVAVAATGIFASFCAWLAPRAPDAT